MSRTIKSLTAALMTLTATLTPMSASWAAPKPPAGTFNSNASKKAWPHVERAITMDMAELADKATELKAEFVLSYGLALELGREPATLTPFQRARVQEAFQEFLNQYVYKRDNIPLKGTEDYLLGQPDFWIMMARTLGRPQDRSSITGAVVTGGIGGQQLFDFRPMPDDTRFTQKDYKLTGDAVLNRYMVFASQSCVIYARMAQKMKKVLTIPASQAPHLTPAAYAENQATAQKLYKDSLYLGPQACGGKAYFERVSMAAAGNMGRLGELESDPARLTPDTPETDATLDN